MSGTLTIPNKHDELDELAGRFGGILEGLLEEFQTEWQKSADERDERVLARARADAQAAHEQWVAETDAVDRKYAMPAGAEDGDDGRRKGQKFSIARMSLAVGKKDWETFAPFEREVCLAIQKAQSTDNDTLGGFLVPEEHSNQIIDLLRPNVVLTMLGATEQVGGRPVPMILPKLTGDVSATWVPENGTIPASDATFGQVILRPRKVAARVKLSTEITQHSVPAADAVVMMSMARQLAVAFDRGGLVGTGNDQPNGIVNLATQIVDFSAGTPPAIYKHLIEMMQRVDAANAGSNAGGRYGWAVHPDVVHKAQVSAGDKASSADDPEVARRLLTEGKLPNLMGVPFQTTTQLVKPTGSASGASLIYGDWTHVWFGRWSQIAIRASDTASDAFENDQVHIRGIMRGDVVVIHTESFSTGTKYPAF